MWILISISLLLNLHQWQVQRALVREIRKIRAAVVGASVLGQLMYYAPPKVTSAPDCKIRILSESTTTKH